MIFLYIHIFFVFFLYIYTYLHDVAEIDIATYIAIAQRYHKAWYLECYLY